MLGIIFFSFLFFFCKERYKFLSNLIFSFPIIIIFFLSFGLNNEEKISSDYVFVRVKNSEFNYTENPSFISGSTGAVLYDLFVNNPTTYVTTIGLYNTSNELLAVAKLSKPLKKDFTKEALIRVKLDF
jgi:hypothetical protein